MFFELSKLISILLVPLHLLIISFFILMVTCFWFKKSSYRLLIPFCVFWFIWFLLVIIWNYGYPEASPFFDVLIAVLLSILNLIALNFLKSNCECKYF